MSASDEEVHSPPDNNDNQEREHEHINDSSIHNSYLTASSSSSDDVSSENGEHIDHSERNENNENEESDVDIDDVMVQLGILLSTMRENSDRHDLHEQYEQHEGGSVGDEEDVSSQNHSDDGCDKDNKEAHIDENDTGILKRCSHYDRGCHLLFPCCNAFYPCRFCHNDATTDYRLDPKLKHEADRKAVVTVKCRFCETVQDISEKCSKCEILFGRYFCSVCKLIDLQDKGQFHCEKCGICRQGGRDNFVHCDTCGICVPNQDHKCSRKIEGDCPVCCLPLFDAVNTTTTTKCGHWMHTACFREHTKHFNTCPLCLKSLSDSSAFNAYLDQQIEATPLPDEYKDKMVDILCNDCGAKCNVKFHFYGLKCSGCSGYNTKRV
ncbi:RING finger and CHY zinc finger domain-containing protein 1 [Yasminevirus sp. GU-2018]|uniref:RING finger and CHY zinc finger domain-containing protein 1 n=1 Tax=Yasminevirus sp. GU-2018 TaxID=2420051 RepID=A0A5K0U9N3_9VIRU|nr:RING finger and CHY zinc finger domain-containing protein 1 [Yasminevirus sp. GU-2018]